MGDEVARADEYQDAHQEGGDVEQEDEGDVDLYGHRAHIIGAGIELHQAGEVLQQAKS